MPSAAQTFAPHEKLMMLPLAPAIANEISLDYHLRLEMIRIGHGNEYHLGSVTQAVLTAMMLSQTSGANVRQRALCGGEGSRRALSPDRP